MVNAHRIVIAIFVLLILVAVDLTAADQVDYRSPFAVGVGAAELGRGGTGVATAGNASSIYWNPALLAGVDRPEVQLFHMSLFMETAYDFVAVAYPTLSAGAFGLAVGDLSSGKIERFDNYERVGTFASHQGILIGGYGFSLVPGVALGATVKGVFFDIDKYRDSGFGFDMGASYEPGFAPGLQAGLKVGDLAGPRLKLFETEQRFPWSIRAGVRYEGDLARRIKGGAEVDFEKIERNATNVFAGAEIGVADLLYLRAGYLADRASLGVGLAYRNLRVDYAYAGLEELGASHRMSLSISFGASVAERKAAHEARLVEARIEQLNRQTEARTQQEIDSLRQVGEAHESAGRFFEALSVQYRILALNDQDSVALSKVPVLLDRYKTQITLEASGQQLGGLIRKQIELGDAYQQKGQLDRAIDQFSLALILDPQNVEAKRKQETAIAQKRREIDAAKAQGTEARRRGDYRAALEAVNRVLQLAPDDAWAKQTKEELYRVVASTRHLDLALRAYDRQDYALATAEVDSALALNPQSEGARALKTRLARFTASETTLEDIKKNETHWQVYIKGLERYQEGDYDSALTLWRSLLEFYPNNPHLKRNIDQAAERLGRR